MEKFIVSGEPAQADVVFQPNTTCTQCKKEVRSPHLLCCLHSVCEECLPAMAVEGQRIKCGECGNTSTHCSSSSRRGVENQTECRAGLIHCVPIPNGPLSRYMEGVKIIGKTCRSHAIPCGNKRCKTPDSPSTVYCTDCSIFMCECCSLGHEVFAPFEDHTVKNVEEMGGLSPADCQQMLSKSPTANTCPLHRGKVLEYCCEQCSLLMCQTCATNSKRPESKPHKPKHIPANPTVAEPHRQALKAAHQATICFGKKCEAVEEQLQTELRTVEQTTEASLGDLNTAFQSIHAAMQRRKEELHRQIINAAKEKKRAIKSRLRSVQSEKKTAVNAASTLDFLVKSGNTHDLIASKDLAQTHQSVLNSKWCEDKLKTTVTVSSVLRFEAANQEAVLKALEEFGIVTDGACPDKSECTVSAKPVSTVANPVPLNSEVHVIAFDSKGIACTRGGDKIEAFLYPKSRTAGPAIKARVEDNANGTYSVSFPTAVYPGLCRISFEVNGKILRGTLFSVTLHRHIRCIKSPKNYLPFPQPHGLLHSVTVSLRGTIFVSDFSGHKIHVFSKERKFMKSFDTNRSGERRVDSPVGLTVSSDGLVCVADCHNSRIRIFTEDGAFVRQLGSGWLESPLNVTINCDDQFLYVADAYNHRVSIYTLGGKHVCNIGMQPLKGKRAASPMPSGVAFSPDGDMYVTDFACHRVQVFDAYGQYKRVFGQGQLKEPSDIVITGDGDVFVADEGNNRIAVFSISSCGSTSNLIHSFKVERPTGLAIDEDGNILVANGQVVVF